MFRAFAISLLCGLTANAQETRASLSGILTDSSAAAISGAAVKLTNMRLFNPLSFAAISSFNARQLKI